MREIAKRIEEKYRQRNDQLGWRFLYGPATTLDRARVAFVGLNPGGTGEKEGQGQLSCENGSAFVTESWSNHPPGESVLQKQVLALFDRLGEEPINVLSGNLVPFRSRDWASLADKGDAVHFGTRLWVEIFKDLKPETIVTMGRIPFEALASGIGCTNFERHHVGWGNISARRTNTPFGRLIGLPHLSRFSVMQRQASQAYLDSLFESQ